MSTPGPSGIPEVITVPVHHGMFCWFEHHSDSPERAVEYWTALVGGEHVAVPLPCGGTMYLMNSGTHHRWSLRALSGCAVPLVERGPHWLPYVAVDDTDAAHARAFTAGVCVRAGLSRWAPRSCLGLRIQPRNLIEVLRSMKLLNTSIPCLLSALLGCVPCAAAADSNLEFDNGTKGWQTVLDGVMGGLSTGRVAAGEGGTLRFSGELSLENNGGFSQIRTAVPEGTFAGATGLALRVKGDGRTYQCDIRSSRLRLMAGGYQRTFKTTAGEWIDVEIPFSECVANSFGQRIRNAPALDPASIESVGITLADKKEGPFAIEVDWIRPMGKADAERTSSGSLATVAAKANLTTLLELVKAAEIALPTDAKVTIFAPTNEAFAKLPREQVQFLTSAQGKSTLQAILKHHVVAQSLESSALLDRRRLKALSGQSLDIDPSALTIDGARLVATDVAFDGGLVHVIDGVMLPELRSIEQIVAEDDRVATLRAAIGAAGIGSQLGSQNPGPWTVLAPSNAAFAAIPADTLKALLADKPALTAVLAAHVLPSAIRRDEMLAQGSARTLMGDGSVAFKLDSGSITVDGARIEIADIEAANGVIHVIDRVLPARSGASSPTRPSADTSMMTAATPERARQAAAILELAIERGVPRFNAGDASSCAALYELAIVSVMLLGEDTLSTGAKADLAQALEQGAAHEDASERAWTYRRAMDRALGQMAELMKPAS